MLHFAVTFMLVVSGIIKKVNRVDHVVFLIFLFVSGFFFFSVNDEVSAIHWEGSPRP